MTDRELLESAAKAAGWTITWTGIGGDMPNPIMFNENDATSGVWNPLTNDGYALRLAVKLKMRIGIDSLPVGYVVVMSDDPLRKDTHEPIDGDPYDATRRAIVRAAAEIGKATEERNFCPRCGKRTNDIHTCTPPKD